jgi:hypothetical protein
VHESLGQGPHAPTAGRKAISSQRFISERDTSDTSDTLHTTDLPPHAPLHMHAATGDAQQSRGRVVSPMHTCILRAHCCARLTHSVCCSHPQHLPHDTCAAAPLPAHATGLHKHCRCTVTAHKTGAAALCVHHSMHRCQHGAACMRTPLRRMLASPLQVPCLAGSVSQLEQLPPLHALCLPTPGGPAATRSLQTQHVRCSCMLSESASPRAKYACMRRRACPACRARTLTRRHAQQQHGTRRRGRRLHAQRRWERCQAWRSRRPW